MTLAEFFKRVPDLDFQRRHVLTAGTWVAVGMLALGIFHDAALAVLVGSVCVVGYWRILRFARMADRAERAARQEQALVEAGMRDEMRQLLGE